MLTPSRESFLAGIGSIAIAVGLGAQDFVRNVVGGLVVIANRPYQLGDRVRIGEAYGEIHQIELRSTKLITPDKTLVVIPNSDVLTKQVFNSNAGSPDSMIVTNLFLPAAIDPAAALRAGYEAA